MLVQYYSLKSLASIKENLTAEDYERHCNDIILRNKTFVYFEQPTTTSSPGPAPSQLRRPRRVMRDITNIIKEN